MFEYRNTIAELQNKNLNVATENKKLVDEVNSLKNQQKKNRYSVTNLKCNCNQALCHLKIRAEKKAEKKNLFNVIHNFRTRTELRGKEPTNDLDFVRNS